MLNAVGIVVLVTLVGEYLLGVVVDRLNLRAMKGEPPPELAHVYEAGAYARAQDYARTRAAFALWPRTLGLALTLGFWLAGGFGWLDRVLGALGFGPIVTGLLFFAALGAGQGLLMLPFRLWSTFVIEERFGFNRTTARTFVSDAAKGLALAVVLGGALGALVLALFAWAGAHAWLVVWGAVTALTLLLQFLAPRWLMPLFMKFEPMPDGPLRSRIVAYARSIDFPLDNVFVVDGSRRSTKANAFFTGFGKHRRIGLFDTLVERHSADELVAVLAHEVGHYKKRHVTQGMVIGVLHMGFVLWLFGRLMQEPALFAAFGVQTPSVHAGLVFCSLLYRPVELVLGLGLNALSRKNEYEADRFAVETTGLARALAAGLEKLSQDNLANLTPHPAYVLLHHSHPPLRERVRAILAAGEELRPAGEHHRPEVGGVA